MYIEPKHVEMTLNSCMTNRYIELFKSWRYTHTLKKSINSEITFLSESSELLHHVRFSSNLNLKVRKTSYFVDLCY